MVLRKNFLRILRPSGLKNEIDFDSRSFFIPPATSEAASARQKYSQTTTTMLEKCLAENARLRLTCETKNQSDIVAGNNEKAAAAGTSFAPCMSVGAATRR
ncbi:MAG: hypothetical protein ABSA26_16690 [Thermoguttaceae bacterium]